jgi:acetyl-CoA C-acetyltransferase
MTSTHITTTLHNELRTHHKQTGLETMRIGGGQGMAMLLERLT